MSTALVTGATAGIGLSFARQLADRGHDLVLVARDEQRLASVSESLSSTYHVDVETLAADLTDKAQLAKVEARLTDPARPVDLLVNNAGFGLKHRFLVNTADQEEAMLDVLVVAVMRLTHAALTGMTERGGGGIINVSSAAAWLPRGTYGAAKAWVNSFTEWAHHEYAGQGVKVMALCPGFTKTEFHQRMGVGRDSAPDFMWLDVDKLVAVGLRDYEKGRVFSVPSAQYKAVVAAGRLIPRGVLQRFQSLGRK